MSNNQSYQKLKKIWYKKLADSGFRDIENAKSFKFNVRATPDHISADPETTYDYYRLASLFLLDHTFVNEVERIIWEYHASGMSYRAIFETLTAAKVLKCGKKTLNKDSVMGIVKALKKLMFDRYNV